jgi:hypothetical protein
MTIEIVIFPLNMVDLSTVMLVYQRINIWLYDGYIHGLLNIKTSLIPPSYVLKSGHPNHWFAH